MRRVLRRKNAPWVSPVGYIQYLRVQNTTHAVMTTYQKRASHRGIVRVRREFDAEEARVRMRKVGRTRQIRFLNFERPWPIARRWQARATPNKSKEFRTLVVRERPHDIPEAINHWMCRSVTLVDGVLAQNVDVDFRTAGYFDLELFPCKK